RRQSTDSSGPPLHRSRRPDRRARRDPRRTSESRDVRPAARPLSPGRRATSRRASRRVLPHRGGRPSGEHVLGRDATAPRHRRGRLTRQHLEEADGLAGRIAIMKAGRIIAEGTPSDLKRQRGGDRIEITASHQVAARAIRDALLPTDAASSEEAVVELDEETGVVTSPATRGTRDLAAAVRRLDAADITADDIVLRRPTLDEVFLALTEKEDA